jgi:hypothetical protein
MFAAVLVAPGLLQAQQAATTPAPAQEPERVVKVLRVREGEAENVATLLRNYKVDVRTSERLGLLTVAGTLDDVVKAETAAREIEKLSTRAYGSAAQDVELTIHFLGIQEEDTPPPAVLRDVVAELRKTFPFPGYKLLETIAVRSRVGEDSRILGLLPETLEAGMPPKNYHFESRIFGIETRQTPQLIRFAFVRATVRMPVMIQLPPNQAAPNLNYEDVSINTSLEVPDGKTVVVGKAGSTGASRGYLLVLTAKVVK